MYLSRRVSACRAICVIPFSSQFQQSESSGPAQSTSQGTQVILIFSCVKSKGCRLFIMSNYITNIVLVSNICFHSYPASANVFFAYVAIWGKGKFLPKIYANREM